MGASCRDPGSTGLVLKWDVMVQALDSAVDTGRTAIVSELLKRLMQSDPLRLS